MTSAPRYDVIGTTYGGYRRPDPRIAALIDGALGEARSVVDVGSGTGSYEPGGRAVLAVEPSLTMIRQRQPAAAPVIRAFAGDLPFPDRWFDAALAVLTVHHWDDAYAGLAEMARVAPAQVVLTWDPATFAEFWLVAEYLPVWAAAEANLATLATVMDALDVVDVVPVPIPSDCTDGFCGAYWRRPDHFLDPAARTAISGFSLCPADAVDTAIQRLEADLADGSWRERHHDLYELDEIDLGYRIVIAGSPAAAAA